MATTHLALVPRAAVCLSIALTVTLGVGSAVARPTSGSRNIQDFAQSGFQARLTGALDCLFVETTVRYFAGDNLQNPIGSGKPVSWSDAPISLGVFDSCADDAEVLHLEGLGFPDGGADFDRLERAELSVSQVTLSDGLGTFVDAEIHLVWVGNDDATVSIGHDRDGRSFRQQRSESAAVIGTVRFGASPLWDDLTFTGDDAHDASIGTANEITLP
jgi:hypothetical protein